MKLTTTVQFEIFFIVIKTFCLKLVSAYFYQIIIFHRMIGLQKLWKMFFISSKKLFSFSRYSNFCVFVFPSFFPVSHCFSGWFKRILQVHDVINCLNKNLITHFVWCLEKEIGRDIEILSIDRVSNTEHFMENSCRKCAPKPSPRSFFSFVK